MPLYEFRCAADCGPFERSFPMADAPRSITCPGCERDVARLVSSPRLGHGILVRDEPPRPHEKVGSRTGRRDRSAAPGHGRTSTRHEQSAAPPTSSSLTGHRRSAHAEVVFPLDSTKKFEDQVKSATTAGTRTSRRWRPSSPATSFRVHCREWFDGAIVNDDSADDILNAPLMTVHKLSGPFAVEGAKPGDLLIVDILDVGPIPQEDSGPLAGQGWGYTGIFANDNGGGFLTEQFPDAYKAIWDFTGQIATSRHVPGVSFAGMIHPGLMGTAPSAELLASWNRREGGADRHRPGPGAAAGPAARAAGRGPRQRCRRRLRPGRRRGRPHRATAGERRQPGHQEPVQGQPGLLPGVRRRRQPLARRPALLPGRRRDHLLRRHRDGRLHRPACRCSSRAAWRPTASPRTPSSCPATSTRSTASGWPSPAPR